MSVEIPKFPTVTFLHGASADDDRRVYQEHGIGGSGLEGARERKKGGHLSPKEKLTTQSRCGTASGTLLPSSSAGGHGSARTFSIIFIMG